MTTQLQSAAATAKHAGPPLWLPASLYTVLFIAGLVPVTMFGGLPYWPGPWEPAAVITHFFQTQAPRVLTCIFLQIGATICLGLFTAVVVSRLHFLGVRAAGVHIALFGGFLTVFDGLVSAFSTWASINPAVAASAPVLLGLYYFGFALGGPGFSMPMGLLMAGVSATSAFRKLLPKWLIVLGLLLAAAGELSFFYFLSPKLLFLIPLTRFPGFIWIVAVGFLMPNRRPNQGSPGTSPIQ
ncbi:MAG TPA: hypothetical protein VKB38_00395 [Terracidiphilus sp.]|nr:hypothetical protein [Terracidiphilus sp.]